MFAWLGRMYRRIRRPRRYWYAVKRTRSQAWLVDAVRGEYDLEFGRAEWFDTPTHAAWALGITGLQREHTLVRLAAQPTTNHYEMKEVQW